MCGFEELKICLAILTKKKIKNSLDLAILKNIFILVKIVQNFPAIAG